MNTIFKPYVVSAGIFLMLAFGVAALLAAFSYGRSTHPAGSFQVQGEGKVVAIPDVAFVNFSVVTEGGTDVALLQAQNTEKANGAIAFAKEQGIEKKDIKTSAYRIQPRYQYSPCFKKDQVCPPPEIVGYSISHSVEIKIRNFERLGFILSSLVEKGVNTVSDVSFGVEDPELIQNQARGQAVQKAKEKAKALAKAGGFRLGRLLSIEEGSFSPVSLYAFEKARSEDGASAPAVEPGSQDIIVNVTLRFEIQ